MTRNKRRMADDVSADPRTEYQRRLDLRQSEAARCALLDGRVAFSRGLVFLSAIALLAGVLGNQNVPLWSPVAAAGLFVLLVIFHQRIVDRLKRAETAVRFYQTGLARLDDRWSEAGATGERYADAAHLYSGDLDIFGQGSLFQLLSQARTRLGEDTLADWLSQPAGEEAILRRQSALGELAGRLDLREYLALLDAEVHDEIDQNRLVRWSQEEPRRVSRSRRVIAVCLALAAVAGLAGWSFLGIGPSPLIAVLFVEAIFTFRFRREIKQQARSANEAGSGLAILAQVLEVMEREQFRTPLLCEIRERLDTAGLPPSRRIARLHNLIQNLNNCLQNQFFAPIALVLCLPVHFVHAIEKWRDRVGSRIPDWLQAVGEFEALSSLAGFAYERPHDSFPEIVSPGPCFEAEALGHPLIPADKRVRNDLTLGGELRLILVSGSNMSGKSTLLRTVGTNVVLAMAGAQVCAQRLRLSPLKLGTTMRISDSLQDGTSLFFAVVRRLKSIVEMTNRDFTLLFLLDEILQGTNSHDRRVGSEGIIRKLIERGAVGLVTTHDLALAEIVDTLGPKAINIHFADHLVDGSMTFNYRIQPGVVKKSNALELMRLMGLDV